MRLVNLDADVIMKSVIKRVWEKDEKLLKVSRRERATQGVNSLTESNPNQG